MVDEGAVRQALEERGVWPSLTQAAKIVGLSKSTLSKRVHAGQVACDVLGFGQGRHVLSPQEVLRVSAHYQRVSQEVVIERLATFLTSRLAVDTSLLRRVLRSLADRAAMRQPQRPNAPQREGADAARLSHSPSGERGQQEAFDALPGWLVAVDRLRGTPESLAGTLAFVLPDDVHGALELGPRVDDPSVKTATSWPSPW